MDGASNAGWLPQVDPSSAGRMTPVNLVLQQVRQDSSPLRLASIVFTEASSQDIKPITLFNQVYKSDQSQSLPNRRGVRQMLDMFLAIRECLANSSREKMPNQIAAIITRYANEIGSNPSIFLNQVRKEMPPVMSRDMAMPKKFLLEAALSDLLAPSAFSARRQAPAGGRLAPLAGQLDLPRRVSQGKGGPAAGASALGPPQRVAAKKGRQIPRLHLERLDPGSAERAKTDRPVADGHGPDDPRYSSRIPSPPKGARRGLLTPIQRPGYSPGGATDRPPRLSPRAQQKYDKRRRARTLSPLKPAGAISEPHSEGASPASTPSSGRLTRRPLEERTPPPLGLSTPALAAKFESLKAKRGKQAESPGRSSEDRLAALMRRSAELRTPTSPRKEPEDR